MIFIILLLFRIHFVFCDEFELEILTSNFKDNLRADPLLQENADFQTSKLFIDKRIEQFVKNIVRMSEEPGRHKRSLQDMKSIVDIKAFRRIPATSPKDIVLFVQNRDLYAVILDEEGGMLRIKKNMENSFIPATEREIPNAVKVTAFPRNDGTIIAVATNSTSSENPKNQIKVYIFSKNEKLEAIQTENTAFVTDIVIWEHQNDLFMCGSSFAAKFLLYKWRGQHFDVIQNITGQGTKRITPFRIHNVAYLALANTKPADESSKIYAHILRYDPDTEKYKLYQRLETYACTDIKYFETISDRKRREHFIVVGNGYREDHMGNVTHRTRSIIYKYIDDYFIPFQSIVLDGVNEWLPIKFENGNVVLLALTLDGIKCFQYDGWRFIESQIRFLDVVSNAALRDVRRVHSYKIEKKTVLLLADAQHNGRMENMFTLTLNTTNGLVKQYDQLLTWCLKNKEKIENIYTEIVGESRRGDDDQTLVIESQVSFMDELIPTLQAYDLRLSKISDKMQQMLQTNNNHTIEGNITISNLILHNTGIMKNLHIDKINNISVNDVLDNTLDMNRGFNINSSTEFTSMRTEKLIMPEIINGMEIGTLKHTDDDIEFIDLIVNGTVRCDKEMIIEGKMNDVKFDSNHLLKSNEDQVFDIFRTHSIDIGEVKVDNINNVSLLVDNRSAGTEPVENAINEFDTLKVKALTVGGYVNDLNIGVISTYSLRNTGDQVISKPYFFERLETDNMDVRKVQDKQLKDMVIITTGNYTINNDIKFVDDVDIGNLNVVKQLDGLAVKDGKLDILLRESADVQFVSGSKSFENLELLNPIKLQGKIKGQPFDEMNPAIQIDSDVEVNRSVTKITGNVNVEELILTKDILSPNKEEATKDSLLRVTEHGVKLTDAVVPIHLQFLDHISVKELSTDSINNLNPKNWLVNGAKEAQIIQGEKIFPGDLEITGNSVVSNINGIDITELQTNVLRRDGDQIITGKHSVKYLAVEKEIITNNTKFGDKKWTDVVTTDKEQEINGPVTFISNMILSSMNVANLQTRDLINNLSFVDLVSDAYTSESDQKLSGMKKFDNLVIEELVAENVDKHLDSLENGDFKVEDLRTMRSLSVKNINFNKKVNGIDTSFLLKHSNSNNTHNGVGTEFGTMTVHGEVFVESNRINRVELQDFENNTVKIDEPFEFDAMKIDGIIAREAVKMDGQIENLDVDNIFQNNDKIPQHFPDKKIIQGTMKVLGNVHIGDTLNKVDISNMCGYGSDTRKPIIVEGNVQFAKGPDVFTINGAEVRKFTANAWFSDRSVALHGNIQFKGNSTFMAPITVQGIVNDHDINFLAKSYMSKTRDQIVSAKMHFIDELLFTKDLVSPQLNINGSVNGIDIPTLPKRVILNRAQLFEGLVYYENCSVLSTSGTFLVNKLNLEREVMRNDRPNMITGPKRFKNIEIGTLRTMERNIVVQNVDLNYWLENAVQRSGSFRIFGQLSFGNATFEKGIGLKGTMNGLKFSKKSIMSKSEPQTITGRKVFTPASMDIAFKVLKVKGTLNEVNVGELVHNQASTGNDNIFRSPVVFRNNLTTRNINFRSLYQGINITEFIRNVTTLESLNDLSNYYENLLDMSTKIEKSLKDQAFYMNYFKRVYFAPKTATVYPTSRKDKTSIMSFTNENGSFILRFLDWDEKLNIFENNEGYAMNLGPVPYFFTKLSHANRDYIYLEFDEKNSKDGLMYGKLLHIENATDFTSQSFETKGTRMLTSFNMEIAGYSCLLFIDNSYSIRIMCSDSQDKFHLPQSIPLENVSKATTLSIGSSLYLIALSALSPEENQVTTWKLNNCTHRFEHDQTIEVVNGVSLDTVSFFNNHYLAIVHGHLENTMDFGKVEVLTFDPDHEKFIFSQRILETNPTGIAFATLPSKELVLYVLTAGERFNVYTYEGIAGFSKKTTIITDISDIDHFNIHNKHFVISKHNGEIEILEAVFKGQYVED